MGAGLKPLLSFCNEKTRKPITQTQTEDKVMSSVNTNTCKLDRTKKCERIAKDENDSNPVMH